MVLSIIYSKQKKCRKNKIIWWVPVGLNTGGKKVEPVESVGNIISLKLTISAKNVCQKIINMNNK